MHFSTHFNALYFRNEPAEQLLRVLTRVARITAAVLRELQSCTGITVLTVCDSN